MRCALAVALAAAALSQPPWLRSAVAQGTSTEVLAARLEERDGDVPRVVITRCEGVWFVCPTPADAPEVFDPPYEGPRQACSLSLSVSVVTPLDELLFALNTPFSDASGLDDAVLWSVETGPSARWRQGGHKASLQRRRLADGTWAIERELLVAPLVGGPGALMRDYGHYCPFGSGPGSAASLAERMRSGVAAVAPGAPWRGVLAGAGEVERPTLTVRVLEPSRPGLVREYDVLAGPDPALVRTRARTLIEGAQPAGYRATVTEAERLNQCRGRCYATRVHERTGTAGDSFELTSVDEVCLRLHHATDSHPLLAAALPDLASAPEGEIRQALERTEALALGGVAREMVDEMAAVRWPLDEWGAER